MTVEKARRNAVLVNDTSVDNHWGCIRVVRTLRILAERHGIDIVGSIPAHQDWQANPAYLRMIESADLLIVNGEGTLHNDRPQAFRLLGIGAHARSLGIPAVLINASWHRNSEALAALLPNFAILATRDSYSAREASAFGVRPIVVPDLSLYLDDCPVRRRTGIGITDSVVPAIKASLESRRREWNARYVAISFSRKGLAGTYSFFRQSVGKRDLLRAASLGRILRSRYVQFVRQCRSEAAYLELTAGLELIVSSRFHSAAIALNARTPVLAVAPGASDRETDGNKLRGLVEDCGLESWRLVDAGSVDQSLLKEAVRWTGAEEKNLHEFLMAGRSRTDQLFGQIARLL